MLKPIKFLKGYSLIESNSEEGIESIFIGDFTFLAPQNAQNIVVTETDIICLSPNASEVLTDSCHIPISQLSEVIQSISIMYTETEKLLTISTTLPKNKKLTRTERLAYQDSASDWVEYKLKLSAYLQNLTSIQVALLLPTFGIVPNLSDYTKKLTAPNNNGYTVSSVVIST
jgi:hypothetical protein